MASPYATTALVACEMASNFTEALRADVDRLRTRLAELQACARLEAFSREDCAFMEASLHNAKAAAEQAMYRAGARTLTPEDRAQAEEASHR